jgi:membrane-associated phospholipid phosphatase
MASPPLTRAWRLLAACFVVLFVSALYLAPMYVPFMRPTVLTPTALDRAIPFLEWTIWIYYSYALLLVLPLFVCRDDHRAVHVVYSIMANSLVAVVVFFVWPTAGAAQQPTSGGWVGLLWSVLQAVDRPANLFPSLHVANACTSALALWREQRGWRPFAVAWTLLIAVSTLTTKQHLFIDLWGGMALAGFSDWTATRLVERTQDRRTSRPSHPRSENAVYLTLMTTTLASSIGSAKAIRSALIAS